jgi:hypothetical protein
MLQILAMSRTLSLVLGLTAAAATAVAQDSAQAAPGEESDTSQVQNPPGYRGMERPANVLPPDSATQDTAAGAVEDRVTGTYDDSTWQDTAQGRQNPAGYRGMERPVGDSTVAGDTATAVDTATADTTTSGRFKSTKKARSDTTSGDSTINDPQGKGRLERPAAADSAEVADTTDSQ